MKKDMVEILKRLIESDQGEVVKIFNYQEFGKSIVLVTDFNLLIEAYQKIDNFIIKGILMKCLVSLFRDRLESKIKIIKDKYLIKAEILIQFPEQVFEILEVTSIVEEHLSGLDYLELIILKKNIIELEGNEKYVFLRKVITAKILCKIQDINNISLLKEAMDLEIEVSTKEIMRINLPLIPLPHSPPEIYII